MAWIFALAALICFLLVLFGVVTVGIINLTVLGFVFIAAWALLSSSPWWPVRR